MPQWISGELFTGSGKKYEDLKEKQVLVFSERIGYLLLCWMDRLRQNAFYVGTSKDYTVALSGCVSTHEGSGSLTWRANGQYLFVCIAWPSQHCTTPTNYPKVTQYVIQTFHNWLYSGGRAVVYSVDKTLPSPCRNGLAHETKSHCARMRMASVLRLNYKLNYRLLHHFDY